MKPCFYESDNGSMRAHVQTPAPLGGCRCGGLKYLYPDLGNLRERLGRTGGGVEEGVCVVSGKRKRESE